MEQWGSDRHEQATELLRQCFPADDLHADDVRACLWDDPDPSVVLGVAGGAGLGAAVVRGAGETAVLHLQVLAVVPEARRRGRASELLASLGAWGREQQASTVVAGAGAPFYLWPGVDFSWTAALCLFEGRGFRDRGATFNMAFPDTFRADPPVGVDVRRLLENDDVTAVTAFCESHHPNWVAELRRGVDHGTAFGAWTDGEVSGFACHSVNRLGWVGPMATHPDRRSSGVGGALLSALTADIGALGRNRVEVAWVGPASFYAKAAGAEVSRVFRTLSRRLA